MAAARKRRGQKPIKFQLRYSPADIPRFAAEYLAEVTQGRTGAQWDQEMENAGKNIVNGSGTRNDANTIYRWKSRRRMDLFRRNSDAEVAQALKDAIGARSVRKALDALTQLEGVGVKMASAILTALFPNRYTVLDVRALEAFGLGNGDSVRLYLLYLRACRNMARKYGVELRDFDRANWWWSAKIKRGRSACSNPAKLCSKLMAFSHSRA